MDIEAKRVALIHGVISRISGGISHDGMDGIPTGECMTRDDILRMAREAGIDVKAAFPRNPDVLTRFAQLAVDAAQPAAGPDAQPVAFLHVGGVYGDELEEWELEAEQVLCDELNEKHINKPTALPLYLHPPAADVQPVAWIKKDRSSIEVSIMSSEYMVNLGFEPLYARPPAAAVQDLVASLMIIAGKQRCVDSLMSNVDIALEALKRWEGK